MKRSLFAELMQGVEDMSKHRKGNVALCQYEMSKASVSQARQDESVHAEELVAIEAKCPGSATD